MNGHGHAQPLHVWIVEIGETMPVIDGTARYMRCGILSRTLVDRGHTVTWWSSTFDHARKRQRVDRSGTFEIQPGLEARLLFSRDYRSNGSLKRFLSQRGTAASFAREADSGPRPDLIFCSLPTPELAEESALLGRKYDVPVIIDVNDQWPDSYLLAFPSWLRPLVRPMLHGEFRRIARALGAATSITAVSETYLKWALGYAGRSRRETDAVFPLGYWVPPPSDGEAPHADVQAKYAIRPDAFVALFVGTFGASYDLETVVKVAAALNAQETKDVQFLLVGDGDQKSRLHQMAAGLDNLTFTGWVDGGELNGLLRLASVGLASYTADCYQSLPYKPFEYMAGGLPLLSSLRGELEALIRTERIGLHYEPGDVTALTEGIRWLAANPLTRREMGDRARALFDEHFSADVVYPKLVQHIENVAGSHHARM